LIGLNIAKGEESFQNGAIKIDVLKQLFPFKKISFQNLYLEAGEKISDYFDLKKSDLIATRLKDHKLWKGKTKRTLDDAVAMKMQGPIIIFQ
jgi:hypothetical protein